MHFISNFISAFLHDFEWLNDIHSQKLYMLTDSFINDACLKIALICSILINKCT